MVDLNIALLVDRTKKTGDRLVCHVHTLGKNGVPRVKQDIIREC